MKIGSLFSGIGGLELGLERSIPNAKTVWQVERDPYARRVLAKNWPGVAVFEDVRAVGAHNLEPVDLICGGFPCQDLSVAGKGAGIDGKRSGLWGEFARIIGEIRPRYAVVENVPALLGRGMGRILGDLASSGYNARWDCVPAQAIGAHHRRDRLFVIAWAIPNSNSGDLWNGPERNQRRRHNVQRIGGAQSAYHGEPKQVANANSKRELQPGILWGKEWQRAIHGGGPWSIEPGVGRVAYGVSNRMDRLRGLGNAVVPQVSAVIGRVIVELDGKNP